MHRSSKTDLTASAQARTTVDRFVVVQRTIYLKRVSGVALVCTAEAKHVFPKLRISPDEPACLLQSTWMYICLWRDWRPRALRKNRSALL